MSKLKTRLFRLKMTLNKKWPNFYQISLLFLAMFLVFGCAVPQKPNGGPRDVTPPKLLKATPLDQTRNFKAKQIVLDFDEYFKLINPYQEITVTPAPEKPPEFKLSKKSLVITFKDSLLKETTYTINFGKALADVNEGNAVKNFTYVFSTGNLIDSLSITGNVTDNQTSEKEKDVTVMLFTLKQDSLLFGKKKPPIYTSTDTSGNFTLSNLHEGAYKIYALKETSGNKIYDDEKELIGFSSKIINLKRDTTGVKMQLFEQVPEKFRLLQSRFDADGKIFLAFNRSLKKPSLRIISSSALDAQKLVEFSKKRDSAFVYMRNMDFDSLKIVISENNKPIDTTTLRKGRKEAFKNTLLITTSADNGNLLRPGTDLEIYTNSPISSYLPSLISLKEDADYVINYTLVKDTANTKHLTLKYRWKPKATYLLSFADGAITGFWNEQNKKVDKRFVLDNKENYSGLNLTVTFADTAKTYVIELLNENSNNVLRTNVVTKNKTVIDYTNLPVAKYKVRVVYDTNKNGKWDSGSISQNRQPENIWANPKLIVVRKNFEPQEAISIPPEATP